MAHNELATEIIKRQEFLQGDRGNEEAHWQEIAERVIPRHSKQFFGQMQPGRSTGEKRTNQMFDSTAALGLERFAAVMEFMLTPRNSKWHRTVPSDEVLQKNRRVQLWFEQLTNTLFKHRYSSNANFAGQNHENFIGLGAYGSAGLFIDQNDKEPGFRYKAIPLGTLWFVEDHQGRVDTAYRRFPFTARQAVKRWGEKALPDRITRAATDNPEEEFEFIHCVRPNDEVEQNRLDFRGMPFSSTYVAVQDANLITQGGFHTFPYAISRYVTAPGETYGRSPAMLALPSIKTLNEQKKTILKQGHRTVDPVLLTHDDGIVSGISLRPGAINAGGVNKDGRALVHTLPTGNLAVGRDMMNDERAVINDVFLVSLFQILTDNPQMTATEVLERTREKGILLSPTMGRQQSEMLGPLIEREVDLAIRQGLVDPMPPELVEAKGEFTIEYDSPLSRAQKAEEASGLFRSLEFAGQHATMTGDPSALDHINIDAAMPELMSINAVPVRWQSSVDEIKAIREGRAQAQAQQQAIEAAPAIAGLAKAQ